MESLQFSGHDPGAVTLGNFINYYDFHPPEERLKLLPNHLWTLENKERPLTCLDIGCNTGELTTRLHEIIQHSLASQVVDRGEHTAICSILGIDIDPTLIVRAQENNRFKDNVVFKCADFMNDEEKHEVLKDFISNCNGQLDVIFCFSITMWIHLNHGDEGLKKFLSNISRIGKMLVIEPQPWKCYKSAVKRLRRCGKSFPYFDKIHVCDNVEEFIDIFLTETCHFKKVHESTETKWGRRIVFYKKGDELGKNLL